MKRFYPFVKAKYNTKDGEIPIYIRYNFNRVKRTFIPINYCVRPEHWNFQKKWIKQSCSDFEEINDALVNLMTKLGNILTYAKNNSIEPTTDFVLNEMAKEKEHDIKTKRVSLFEQLDFYIEDKKNKVVPDVIKDYKTLRKHLNGFKSFSSQEVKFSNLNPTFYSEFLEYLNFNAIQRNGVIGLSNNTVGKQIRILKGFVRDRMEKKIIPFVELKSFKTIAEETDHIFLSETELANIYKLDLSQIPDLETSRDIFIIGCYTGLRYSDLSNLSLANIDVSNEIIKLTQRKVHKPVIIPMIDYVPDILRKYNYSLPKIHLNDFNLKIKEIGQLAKIDQACEIIQYKGKERIKETKKKYELISSHTCRRSFCTNMYLAGFPSEELMKISGHKSSKAFLTYIKVDSFQAAMRLKQLRQRIAS